MTERSEWSSYWQLYVGHLDDIQTALEPLQKIKINFMNILRLAESFKTMNWPGPTITVFDGLFLGKYKI